MGTSGVIERVDPSTLLVGPNVRQDVELGKEFVASIKQHGVKVPVTAHRTENGLEVIDGQRRTLAAVDAGVAEVPVFVVDEEDAAERIVEQLVVNEHRAGISAADEAAAIKELALFNLSAAAIAKRTGLPRKSVETAIRVGGSEAATAAMRERQVDFESAAIIAEFDDDSEAQADLVAKASQGYYLAHAAQQWRDTRAGQRIAAEIDAMDGVRSIERPGYNSTDPLEIDSLFVDADLTQKVSALSHDELVAIAGDGLCGFPQASGYGDEREWGVGYAIKGWKARGLHTYAWKVGGTSTPTTPEEAAAQKEERRQARENTKAWVAATAVRVDFLKELLQRKSAPKGWEALVAGHLVAVHSNGLSPAQWEMARTLLQVEKVEGSYSQREPIEKHLQSSPPRAPFVALAVAIGSIEGEREFDRKGWFYEDHRRAATARYLRLLQEWGYELSEIEQAVVAA